ncbi:serine/threonine-protein kinase LATS1 [Nilaparvata lugens]|uniref:serine/threonine-protein kinase LATS1 n=1 Tax=Nilaparvata lugens TaxID=108931 RepID=UPI00193D8E6D|nr:serine/threonine-protein kinase LATS1 [Nilaparvata lugens]
MGHQPPPATASMNPASSASSGAGAKSGASSRSSGYHQKALQEIRNSLLPFANSCDGGLGLGSSAASTISTLSTVSSASSSAGVAADSVTAAVVRHALAQLLAMGFTEETATRALKISGGRFEAALDILIKQPPNDGSTLVNGPSKVSSSGLKLIRKPSLERELQCRSSPALDSGAGSSRSDSPRGEHTQLSRQYSPAGLEPPPPLPPPRSGSTPPPPPPPHAPYPPPMLKRMSPAPVARGTSPGGRQPMIVQNGPQVQQQLSQQMQALSIYSAASASAEPPPPYPLVPSPAPPPPPSYSASIQSRQSPTQDYRKSPSSGIYSGPTSAGSPSPTPTSMSNSSSTTPLHSWSARQAKTQPPIIMQSVKSTQVQKPVLQTATAPPPPPTPQQPPPPPSYASSIQHKPVPTTEPPSYASTMQALAAQRGEAATVSTVESSQVPRTSPALHKPPHHPTTPPLPPTSSTTVAVAQNGAASERYPPYKIDHESPIPERKHMSKEKEEERRDCKVRNYSPQAFKFFMEQHVENVLKSYTQRLFRRLQLETEMAKLGLSEEDQCQMRKMLSQKESNYIRLKRAKMDKSMFTKIKPIGVGAFGEVALVKKIDTNHLYAMKTLRKADVLKRNQVAHVKAERDILAEADNEWVVKLYYSFQDKDNLYFVMDYIPGGDLMSLLIKMGIFEEPLARFYIAELTCAVESVHKMGFIHRDIKPDNILIDRDGHIKLTDFGLCTGFRWTHNSKYYQRNGEHGRQDSMEPSEEWQADAECRCNSMAQLKPLERRRRREHQRCLAHSLVGTPNYIAPEVLLHTGYTQLCDWWSVGIILYEMLVGSPPFHAGTPGETQYKVINWETTLHIPKAANLSPEGADLILKLCTSSERRLGKNANEVKSHPFFAGIDFEKGLRRQPPPHRPLIQYSTDTSNFDPVDPDKLRNSVSSDSSKSDEFNDNGKQTFHGFFEFTFRRFFDDGGSSPYANKISVDDNDNQGAVYV